MAQVEPTFVELQDLSLACTRLWELDTNRLKPDVDYQLNLQRGKHMWENGDAATDPLFTFVDPCVFERRTYKLFFDLLDNYERGTGIPEDVTPEELVENNAFLAAVIETAPMRYVYKWLVKKKKFTGDIRAFQKQLDLIWFGLYRRESQNDSSGFEHVFVGEERDGKIMGCHNWIQIYHEERMGRLDYRGFIRPKHRQKNHREPYCHDQLITIQFSWDKEIKPVSSTFIGVSPEFEMALYTLCFMNGKEDNVVQVGPYPCNIKCYTFGRGRNTKIGTAFPEALPLTEEQAAVKIQAVFRGQSARKTTPPPSKGGAPRQNPWNRQNAQPQPRQTAPDLTIEQAAAAGVPKPAPVPVAGGAWGQPRKW